MCTLSWFDFENSASNSFSYYLFVFQFLLCFFVVVLYLFFLFWAFWILFCVLGFPKFPVEVSRCSSAIHSNIFYKKWWVFVFLVLGGSCDVECSDLVSG